MCVIAAKPAGVEMPTEERLINMWYVNPDGAGFMYAAEGKVYIEKGFMKLEHLLDRLDALGKRYDLKKLPMVLHFRITTHGGTKPENTHPFPISDSIGVLRKLKQQTDLGVAHNGIIPVTPRKDISDTMEYIAGQLAPLKRAVPQFYRDKNLLQMIAHATESKLAFLDKKGKIVTVGEFKEDEGVLYSNTSYKGYCHWRDYLWEEDYESGWEYHRMSEIQQKRVMWLDESKGEIVCDLAKGEEVYGEFAIDAAGTLYEYDYAKDLLMEVMDENYQAYNAEWMRLRFDPKSPIISEELVSL